MPVQVPYQMPVMDESQRRETPDPRKYWKSFSNEHRQHIAKACQTGEDMIESGNKVQQQWVVEKLRGLIPMLSVDPAGCRLLQKMVDKAPKCAIDLVDELHGHVVQIIDSPCGNHVVQSIIVELSNK